MGPLCTIWFSSLGSLSPPLLYWLSRFVTPRYLILTSHPHIYINPHLFLLTPHPSPLTLKGAMTWPGYITYPISHRNVITISVYMQIYTCVYILVLVNTCSRGTMLEDDGQSALKL